MNAQSYYILASVLGLIFLALLIFLIYYKLIRKKASRMIQSMLTHKEIRGRDLRQKLAKDGLHVSYELFCFVMNKLVEEGKAERRDTFDSIWYRLPSTVEEHQSEYVAHAAHLGH
jgi:glycerol uptake facilitator-like aquaporin